MSKLRVLLLVSIAGLPLGVVLVVLLAQSDLTVALRWTLGLAALTWWAGAGVALVTRIERPLRTLSNLVTALREGDYSTRARIPSRGAAASPLFSADPMVEALQATNRLADLLDAHRLEAVDATTLAERLLDQVDVAVLGFDEEGRVRLANRAANALLGRGEDVHGATAEQLEIAAWLQGATPRIVEPLRLVNARWQLRSAQFRQGGRPFTLLVLSDLSRVLDEEARRSAFDVVRVLSHEVNNSLTPIQSVAEALATQCAGSDGPSREDVSKAVGIIGSRAEALGSFMAAYAQLSKLPPLVPRPMDVGMWAERVVALETRMAVQLQPGPEVELVADVGQLEQLLINLVRNGVDAALETEGSVTLGWEVGADWLDVWVRDEGLGLLDTANLFVPLYTTKPTGSGIGLVLSREIARAHGGQLTLENRTDGPGCEARLRLPVSP